MFTLTQNYTVIKDTLLTTKLTVFIALFCMLCSKALKLGQWTVNAKNMQRMPIISHTWKYFRKPAAVKF